MNADTDSNPIICFPHFISNLICFFYHLLNAFGKGGTKYSNDRQYYLDFFAENIV